VTTPNTTPSKGTVTQQLILICTKLTTTQKISIAAAIVVVSLLFLFRYDYRITDRSVVRLDRWTQTVERCVDDGNVFKCGRETWLTDEQMSAPQGLTDEQMAAPARGQINR